MRSATQVVSTVKRSRDNLSEVAFSNSTNVRLTPGKNNKTAGLVRGSQLKQPLR